MLDQALQGVQRALPHTRRPGLRRHADFRLQYLDHLVGRLDHPVFADKEDMVARVSYDDLKSELPAWMLPLGSEVERRVLHDFTKCFTRLAEIIHRRRPKPGKLGMASPLIRFLVNVSTGSWTSPVPVAAMVGEVDACGVNKKLGFGYMSQEEWVGVARPSRTFPLAQPIGPQVRDSDASQPGAQRINLLRAQLRVVRLRGGAFIATMGTCPLVWSGERRTRHDKEMRTVAFMSFIGCRDFSNYNVGYGHSDMRAFHSAAATRSLLLGDDDMADAAEACAKSLEDVGAEHDGQFYPWAYGLMSGWRHTMFFPLRVESGAG